LKQLVRILVLGVLVWGVAPVLLSLAVPSGLIIRAHGVSGLLGFSTAVIVTGLVFFDHGWSPPPCTGRRRWLRRLRDLIVLLTVWNVLHFVLRIDNLRQPLVTLEAREPLWIIWFAAAVLASWVMCLLCGRTARRINDQARHQRTILTAVQNLLSEGLALFSPEGRLIYANDAARQLLLDPAAQGDTQGASLRSDAASLLNRVRASGRTASQSMSLSEQLRVTLTVTRASPDTYALLARPTEDLGKSAFYERFIRRIVHDMRNPLAAIIAHSVNLRGYEPESDSTPADRSLALTANTIEVEAQRLTRLVDSMLFDARLSYVPPAAEHFDLLDLVEEVFFQHDEQVGRDEKTLMIETTLQRAPFEGDRDLIARALDNLVDNGVKYSAAGASVRIILDEDARHYRLAVSDTGYGIPPEMLPDRIFEPLVRAHPSGGHKVVSGSGLGLSIVKKVAELHRGSVKAESQVGRGTTISIWLPKTSA